MIIYRVPKNGAREAQRFFTAVVGYRSDIQV
jgi:hypothetical protein